MKFLLNIYLVNVNNSWVTKKCSYFNYARGLEVATDKLLFIFAVFTFLS